MSAEKKLRIGVIFGGRSGEHEVSLMSARSVLSALDPQRYEVTQIGITHQGVWLVGVEALEAMTAGQTTDLVPVTLLPDPTRKGLLSLDISQRAEALGLLSDLDVIFPVLHGTFGEDGTLQGLLELADLAYVGAGVLGSSLGMDKGVFKDVMRANHIPVLESVIVLRSELETNVDTVITRIQDKLNYPIFVKPANMGSSVGVSRCTSRADLLEGLLEAARYDRRILVERGVNAREIEVSVLGNDDPIASAPGEVIPSREFYSYEAKYIDDLSELLIPAPLPDELNQEIRELAVKAYRAIDCAGMARVDFLLEKKASGAMARPGLYLNEVNTIPGFTQISMYPKLWDASGLPYPELVDRLIELAIERKAERDRTEHCYHTEETSN
jgi:D-alanine-D-alanine ligase